MGRTEGKKRRAAEDESGVAILSMNISEDRNSGDSGEEESVMHAHARVTKAGHDSKVTDNQQLVSGMERSPP